MHHSVSLSLFYHQQVLTVVNVIKAKPQLFKSRRSECHFANQSINLPINDQLVNQSIIQSTNHSISRPINQSICQSISRSISQQISQSANQLIDHTNNQSMKKNTAFTYLEFISAFIIKMEVLKVCSQQAAFSRIPHK